MMSCSLNKLMPLRFIQGAAAFLALLLLLGCSDDGGLGLSSNQPLPPFDPDAQYQGRTALEYAQELSDLSPQVQSRALQNLRHFGVNALPARDAVRRVIDSDAPDGVKLLALEVLSTMQAPEAPALIRQKLADPEFLAQDNYPGLMLLAQQVSGIQQEHLIADMARLVASNPSHAAVLMTSERFSAPVQNALIEALFNAEHDARATQYFITRLTSFDFLDDKARAGYVRANVEAARQWQVQNDTLRMLLEIGTEEAMHAAIAIVDHGPGAAFARRGQMAQFTARNVDALKVIEMLIQEAREAREAREIELILAGLAGIPAHVEEPRVQAFERELAERLREEFGNSQQFVDQLREQRLEFVSSGSAEIVSAREAVIAGLREFMFEGPTEDHQGYATAWLWNFVKRSLERGSLMPIFPALDPIFEAMLAPDLPDTVYATAWAGMDPAIAHRDPETYARRMAEVVWESKWLNIDALIAEKRPHQDLWSGPAAQHLRAHAEDRVFAPHLITAIAESYEGHRGSDQINLAIRLLDHAVGWSMGRGVNRDPLSRRPERAVGTAAIGQMLASPGASHERLALSHMPQPNRGSLTPVWPMVWRHMQPVNNRVDGIIALLEPIVFATSPTPLHVAMDQSQPAEISRMHQQFSRVFVNHHSRFPDEMPGYLEMLERMAEQSPDERFRQIAREALAYMARWR